nr:DUF3037 domain-containing protein [Qipengyuania xiapuensis]
MIVRFRPYAETGEFANIGVIVFDMENDEADFRLANRRFARIGHFFDPKAHRAYSLAIQNLRVEIPRITEYLPENFASHPASDRSHFWELKESSILFSTPRVIRSDLSLKAVTHQLFDRFVKRDFEKPEALESALIRDIRRLLKREGITHFRGIAIEDELIPLKLPLGFQNGRLAAIKPLAFEHKNPLHIIDYGAHWKKRLSYHLDKGNLFEKRVLLPLKLPKTADSAHREAFQIAYKDLKQLPFDFSLDFGNDDHIAGDVLNFASRFPPLQREWTS